MSETTAVAEPMETAQTTQTRSTVRLVDLERFKDTCLFSITIKKWGNRAQVRDMAALAAYLEQLERERAEAAEESQGADGDENGAGGNGKQPAAAAVLVATDRVKSSKVLVKSPTLETLCRELTAIKQWCIERSMPSFFRAGMFVVKQNTVGIIERALRDRVNTVLNSPEGALEKFLKAYPEDIEKARTLPVTKRGLGPLWRERDYPTVSEMRDLFKVEWFWLSLGVPENLPAEMQAEEGEKFKRRLMDAAADIENALRKEFLTLIEHAQERLTAAPGEAPKVFRDSLIGNLMQFIETFDSKDVFGDDRLAGVVAQAKAAMLDERGTAKITAEKLRKFASVREEARTQFAKIKEQLSGMIEEKAQRRFDLSEE